MTTTFLAQISLVLFVKDDFQTNNTSNSSL